MKAQPMVAGLFLLILCSCSSAISQSGTITDFESCVAAGNKVLRSYPPKCAAAGIGVFTKNVSEVLGESPPAVSEPLQYKPICKDLCGDGECAEMVCQAEGCPCAETAQNCPADCH